MHVLSLLLALQATDDLRHLEPTEVRGKAPVPQVLFLSARNAPRFTDGLLDRLAPRAHTPVAQVPIDRATWTLLTAPSPGTP